ncbi:DUF7927 domain-containing protein [Georgenia sp. Marseille-Q6866]
MRGLLVGLTSLALVVSGTASLAAPPDDAEVAALLEEMVTDEAAVEAPTNEQAEGAAADDVVTDGEVAVEGETSEDADTAEDEAVEDGDAAEGEAPAAAPGGEESAENAEQPAPAAEDLDVTPLFVPPDDPGPDEAKIIIRAGGDRTGFGPTSSEVAPLEGATFEFFATDSPDNLAGGTPTGEECTTDANGECGVFVDLSPGTNYFYAVQTGAPEGWIIPEQWAAGTNYRFSTRPGIESSGTVAERTRLLPMQISGTAPDPVWASVRPNPTAPPQCGLDMAMVTDLSNSVTDSSALLAQYKDAATSFVDALTGTPSRVALHTFATNAPADGPSNAGMSLTSVATADSASALTTRIDGFTATPDNNDGGTNWDRGFAQVAEAGEQYDVVLFLTDGAPTFHRNAFGTGSTTNIREVNEAILSANAVKATGAQVVLVGIGPDATLPGAGIRIPLVSGPTAGEDYFVTQFAELAETLEAIATANCAGTLTVVKEVAGLDGTVTDGGAGWTFTTATAGVTPTSATTDETSAVNFEVSYPEDVFTQAVTVTETQQEGYALSPVGGLNAVCTDTTTGAGVPVVNAGALGFTVDVPAADVVSCTVRNAELPPTYDDLTVTKTAVPGFDRDYDWDIEKLVQGSDRQEVPAGTDATFTYDVTVTPSGPLDSGFEVTGEITVTNPNDDVAFTGVDVIDVIPGAVCTVPGGTDVTIAAGDSLTLSYTCDLDGADADTAGTNTATVTWDAAEYLGTSGTASATAGFDFAAADTAISVTDGSVVVTDSEIDLTDYDDGGLQIGNVVTAADGETVFTYDITWPSVPGQCVVYDNTATITNLTGPAFAPMAVGPGIAPLAVNQSSTEVVTVCAGLDLEVEKNVVLGFDRTYLWEIDKDADGTTWTADPDTGTATVGYTVTATPTGSSDGSWAMQGTVTVTNPNEWLDITANVTDTVDVGGGALCTVAGGTGVVVAAGGTVDLSYTCTFVTQPAYSGTNTATATWADTVPTPSSSATGTVDIEPTDWSETPVNATIDVVDDQTDPANPVGLGPATWNAEGTPTVFTYSLVHEGVPGTCVELTNTAWIDQTQQSADETVTVCEQAPPTVAKTADASVDRQYLWQVEKSVDQTSVVVDEGTGEAVFGYVVSAVPAGFGDSGWELDGTVTVANPNDFAPVTVSVTDVVDVGGGAVCVVEDGEDVVIPASGTVTLDYSCTFTAEPEDEGTNTATVTWTDTAGAVQATTATADVEFLLDEETDATVDVVDDQTDPANPVTLGTATWNAEGTPVVFEYDLTHTGVPGECVEFTNTAWVEVTGDDPEDSTTAELCVSTLEHTKTAVGADQLPDGSWLVRYEIDVVNDSTFTEVYSLSDTLEYSDGITPLGALWFPQGDPTGGGAWTEPVADNPTAVLATDVEIAAGTTHTYVVLVTADVAAGVIGTEAGLCDDEELSEGGGFLNAATLAVLDDDETVRACAEPAAPTIEKTPGDLVANDDGTWRATYSIVVVNASDDQTVSYDLSDEFDFIEGVDILDASIERDGTSYPDWDGVTQTVVVTGVALPPSTTHVYAVTVTVDLSEVTDPGDTGLRECGVNGSDAGHGLFNEATIVSGNDEYDDEACIPVPDPEITVDKTAVSADQLADGTWTVVYAVVASNDSSVGGVYDLTDTLEYGEGITPLTAGWALEGTDVVGAWGDLPDEPTATLANDRPLAGGDSDTYVVTVTAAVATGVVGTEAGLCDDEELSEGGGFLNAVTLTAHGSTEVDRACDVPVAPTVEKTARDLVANDDGTWDVTYTIAVANLDEDQAVSYDLSDDLTGFAEGVDILDAAVERDGTTYPDWDGVEETEIVTGVTLPAATTHTYIVTVTIDLSEVAVDEDVRECDDDGSTGGQGLFNEVTIESGDDEYDDDACVPIPEPELSVDKTAVSADQLPDGTWQVVYEVVAANASSMAGVYDLTDTLEYGEGITPLSATWTLEGSDVAGEWTDLPDELTVTLATDRTLAAGGSDTYVVTVVADVAAGVVGTEAGQCTGEDGTDGGGFLNAATLTVDGEDSTDRDCLPPTLERLEKIFDSAVELDDGTWEVSYTLAVDNSHSPARKYYRLDDAPRFAEGVTILDQEAWDVTDSENPENLEWDGEGPILELVAIEAGEVQRYEVTFVVEVGADIPDENLVCGPEGPGRGFFNRAVLTTGNDTIVAEDCGPIGDPAWTLTKSSDPVSGSTVDPGDTITYTLTASPTGDVDPTDLTITDDLSDVLEHARTTGAIEASVGSVDWDGDDLVWDVPRLSETATLTYRVIVDDDAWNVRLLNVVTGDGTPPPLCIECTTTHITPPRTPGLPPTGAAVVGASLLAVLVSLGGLSLATSRRRKEA